LVSAPNARKANHDSRFQPPSRRVDAPVLGRKDRIAAAILLFVQAAIVALYSWF
jgi:hypothetical protein